jgi:hypothetical protein
MTRHEVTAAIANYLITFIGAMCLALLLAFASAKDEADDDKARAQVSEQERSAAQPDTWSKLDQEGRRMVAYDRIKK